MSKVLVVLGATGQQGGSIIDYVLKDSKLSKQYRIRAITRDVGSEKASRLKEKDVDVIQGDVLTKTSLEKAFTGAHTIFAITTASMGPEASSFDEYKIATTIADVAVKKGVEYIVFSTQPSAREISGGKYTKVATFDDKARAEQYIRTLPIKSAFFSPGVFMENLYAPTLAPQRIVNDTWTISCNASPKTLLPLIDVSDTGKFIGAILAEPAKYENKTFHAATAMYSLEDIAAIVSKTTRKTVIYKQISSEQFKERLPFMADTLSDGYSYTDEFGYYGPDSEALVIWAAGNARGTLTTLEDYLEVNPLQLA